MCMYDFSCSTYFQNPNIFDIRSSFTIRDNTDLTPLDGGDGGAPGGVKVPLDQATHSLHRLVIIEQTIILGNLAEVK